MYNFSNLSQLVILFKNKIVKDVCDGANQGIYFFLFPHQGLVKKKVVQTTYTSSEAKNREHSSSLRRVNLMIKRYLHKVSGSNNSRAVAIGQWC